MVKLLTLAVIPAEVSLAKTSEIIVPTNASSIVSVSSTITKGSGVTVNFAASVRKVPAQTLELLNTSILYKLLFLA